jgi:hypothetical protein
MAFVAAYLTIAPASTLVHSFAQAIQAVAVQNQRDRTITKSKREPESVFRANL